MPIRANSHDLRAAPRRSSSVRGALLLGLLLAAPIGIVGCGEEEPAPVVEAPPEKTPEEIEREREKIRLKDLGDRFARAQKLMESDPGAFADNLANLEGLAFSAEGTPLAEPIAQAIAQVKRMREDSARERMAQIVPEVDRLVAAGEYDDAEEMLSQFDPSGLLQETEARKEHDTKLDWVRRSQDAYSEYQRITRRARSLKDQGGLDDLAKAVGVLESFPDLYSDTPYHGEVRSLVDEYFALFLAEKQAKSAKEDVPWTDMTAEELSNRGRSSGDGVVWTESGDEVVGNNTTDAVAMLEIGEDNWTVWAIELEVKVPSGQPLNLGVTLSIPPRASNQKVYDVEGFELETTEWVHILVEYKEGHAHIQNLGTLEPLTEPYRPQRSMGRGGVAILLRPGESVSVRKVRTKLMEKEPEPGAPGGEGGDEPAGADEG